MAYTPIVPYCDVTYADAYIADAVYEQGAWSTLTSAIKSRYLNASTLLIDEIKFVGYKTVPEQANEFPRGGDTVVPDDVMKACVLIAIEMSDGNAMDTTSDLVVQKERLGDAERTYFRDVNSAFGFPSNEAMSLLSPWVKNPLQINMRNSG